MGVINSFQFENHHTGVKIREVRFDHLNLLVGLSGAGKTQLIRALEDLINSGLGRPLNQPKEMDESTAYLMSWTLTFTIKSQNYIWTVLMNQSYRIEKELLKQGDTELANRTKFGFYFQSKELPMIKDSESLISLFRSEPAIAPIFSWLRSLIVVDAERYTHSFRLGKSVLDRYLEENKSLEQIRACEMSDAIVLTFLAQENCPQHFMTVKESYFQIFPKVTDLKVTVDTFEIHTEQFRNTLSLTIQENGRWIDQHDISSGMLKTFRVLATIYFAASGSAILFDELENSLGANCLSEVGDAFLEQGNRLQAVITSHHPLLINKVPLEHWKIVQRHGSEIVVTPAPSVKALQTALKNKFHMLTAYLEDQEDQV